MRADAVITLFVPRRKNYEREEIVLGIAVTLIYGICIGGVVGFIIGHLCQ